MSSSRRSDSAHTNTVPDGNTRGRFKHSLRQIVRLPEVMLRLVREDSWVSDGHRAEYRYNQTLSSHGLNSTTPQLLLPSCFSLKAVDLRERQDEEETGSKL